MADRIIRIEDGHVIKGGRDVEDKNTTKENEHATKKNGYVKKENGYIMEKEGDGNA
jgi:hypothetical protein